MKQIGRAGKRNPGVAHVAHCYYRLSQNWIHTQITHLTRYRPFVLAQHTKNVDAWKGKVRCYTLPEHPTIERFNLGFQHRFGFYPSRYVVAKMKRARVIHAHFGQQGFYVFPLARACGCPLITTFYGYDAALLPEKDPEWKERYETLFTEGTLFLVEGPHMAGQLRRLGCPAGKISVQHLGVPLENYPCRARRLTENEPLRILAASRFTEKKGLPYAIDALAQLVRTGVDARLTIIGDADEGDRHRREKRRILDAIAKTRLDDRITLMGMQPHARLTEAYYSHHVLLAASVQAADGDNEGGAPVTLIEAAATGMPVVSTWHCDIPEVVRHRESGFLAAERDSRGLAAHLKRFVQRPQLLQEMGRAGRKHIEEEYDAQKQGIRLEEIYDSVW